MSVQDDRRELEMCALIGLTPGAGRSGVDAAFEFAEDGHRFAVPVELKSTTRRSVSTGRDIGPSHLEKWRRKVWVFGFYDSRGAALESLLVLGPHDMEIWIDRIERYIAPDFVIGDRLAQRLSLEDLHVICGEKALYRREDAEALQKRQWSNDQYLSEMDVPDGYSPHRMLEILRLRARYLNARGATLNNPHIPKTFFAGFQDREMRVGDDPSGLRSTAQTAIRSMALDDPQLRQISSRADGPS